MSETIKVRATDIGYYEHNLRYPGDVFTLIPRETAIINMASQARDLDAQGKPVMVPITAEQQFAPEWMERVDDNEEERVTGIGQALAKHTDEIRAAKRPGRSRD